MPIVSVATAPWAPRCRCPVGAFGITCLRPGSGRRHVYVSFRPFAVPPSLHLGLTASWRCLALATAGPDLLTSLGDICSLPLLLHILLLHRVGSATRPLTHILPTLWPYSPSPAGGVALASFCPAASRYRFPLPRCFFSPAWTPFEVHFPIWCAPLLSCP